MDIGSRVSQIDDKFRERAVLNMTSRVFEEKSFPNHPIFVVNGLRLESISTFLTDCRERYFCLSVYPPPSLVVAMHPFVSEHENEVEERCFRSRVLQKETE